jgi:hypothetical protein
MSETTTGTEALFLNCGFTISHYMRNLFNLSI